MVDQPHSIHQFPSKTIKVKKGEVLQRSGELARKAFFIKVGLLRSYTIDEKGKEHVFLFAPEGWYISDIYDEVPDKIADLYIDAIEDSEIEVFDRSDVGSKTIHLNSSDVPKLTKRISVLQKRVIMLMSASAKERYQDFLSTYPSIVQRAPQKMIASYLGITPEALSKIKGEILKS